jgi:hypothetical protein
MGVRELVDWEVGGVGNEKRRKRKEKVPRGWS